MTSKIDQGEARKRRTLIETLDWRGVSLSVSYDPSFFVSDLGRDYPQALLEIHVLSPGGAQLPFTETGYRAQFLAPSLVEEAGGPAAYVSAWLNDAASGSAWRRHDEDSRQRSLF